MAQPVNEFEQPYEQKLPQPPSVFYSNEHSQPPQIDIAHYQSGEAIKEIENEESLPLTQSHATKLQVQQPLPPSNTEQSKYISGRTTAANPNVSMLEAYIRRNTTAMRSIVQHEFGGDEGSGYTVRRSNLYELAVHLLSIEPIELASADQQNILYSEEQGGEQLMNQWFLEYCRSSHNQYGAKEEDETISLNEMLQYLRYIVREQQLTVKDTGRKSPYKQSKAYFNDSELTSPEAQPENDVRTELFRTKQRYEQLLENRALSETEKKSLVTMLNSIKQQLAELSHGSPDIPLRQRLRKQYQPEMTIRSCMEIIFEYYCKQSYTAGRNPTFDRILHQNHVLSMSKFMLFCRDFGLVRNTEFLKGQPESDLELKPSDIIEIFKKNSTNYKEMNYEQFQTALHRIAGSIFTDSDALTKMYEHLGIKDEASFRNKLKSLRIPFSYKQAKKTTTPVSNYKFQFFAHGGKLAEGVKETVIERQRSKEKDERGGTASKDPDQVSSKRDHSKNFRSITENVQERHRNDSQDTTRLRHSQLPISRGRRVTSKPTELHSKAESKNSTLQQPIYLNKNYIKLIDADLHAMPTNNHSSYQTSNANITGYSNVYREKMSKKKTGGSKWNYELNSIVSEARDMVSSPEKDEALERKGYLESLIEDEGQDEYLQKHYELEQQQSKGTLKSRVNKRIDQFYQAELQKQRFMKELSQLHDSRTVTANTRGKKLSYI